MTFTFKAGVTALALILAPLAASADHKDSHGGGRGNGHAAQSEHGGGNGQGNAFGHDRAGRGADEDGEDEGEEDSDDVARADHPCGWGLANRDTPCVPPGQAAQGVTTEEWIGAPTEGYAAGDDISDEEYGLIVNTDQLGLDTGELAAGESYALVGDTIVVVDEEGTIVSVVRRAAFPGHSGG